MTPDDERERLDIREQIGRIDRNQAELQKLLAEAQKLSAERLKFNRDPWILLAAAIIAGFAAVAARAPEILHAFGHG